MENLARPRVIKTELINDGVLVFFADGTYAFLSPELILSVFNEDGSSALEGLTIH